MKYIALLVAALALACATDPGERTLVGSWGDEGLGIRATPHSVSIDVICGTGAHPGPAVVAADGTFTLEATVRQFYGDYDIYVTGKVLNERFLEVRLATEYSRPPDQAHLLVKGSRPDFKGYVCLGGARS
jgi:hypothetical protein